MIQPEDRFTQVFHACYPDVLAFVRRRIDPGIAEDVTAEVFAVAWRRWNHAPSEARPWLFGIARNLLADSRRASGRRQSLYLKVATQPPAALIDQTVTVDSLLDLQAAWASEVVPGLVEVEVAVPRLTPALR